MAMRFGVTMFPADYAINVVDLAKAVEDHGLESLLFPEHTHIPAGRQTPYPGGGELPRHYAHTLDPFVALGAIASATSQLLIGTGICLLIQRDPITTAKEVATLDLLSNGRFLFGIGGGWNREEIANHGVDPARRWRVLRERVLAMKRIWSEDAAEYHGELVRFDPIWSWPKPVQKPHPPILIGGDGQRAVEGLIEYGDEWLPRPYRSDRPLADRVAEVNALAERSGRGPIPVNLFGLEIDPSPIEDFEKAGAHRCLFRLPPASAEEVLPLVARCGEIARSFA